MRIGREAIQTIAALAIDLPVRAVNFDDYCVQAMFENRYVVSVSWRPGGYSSGIGDEATFEVAVVGPGGEIITVEGWCTLADIVQIARDTSQRGGD